MLMICGFWNALFFKENKRRRKAFISCNIIDLERASRNKSSHQVIIVRDWKRRYITTDQVKKENNNLDNTDDMTMSQLVHGAHKAHLCSIEEIQVCSAVCRCFTVQLLYMLFEGVLRSTSGERVSFFSQVQFYSEMKCRTIHFHALLFPALLHARGLWCLLLRQRSLPERLFCSLVSENKCFLCFLWKILNDTSTKNMVSLNYQDPVLSLLWIIVLFVVLVCLP